MYSNRRKGVALIIVLAILVLVTALVVGFLVRTGSERTAAAAYRATARTRQLADTVVNLVQAQINQATVATSGSGSTSAWASQPGAIRLFDSSGNQTIYKLYSSGTMVTTSYSTIAGDMPSGSTGNTAWINSPSLWVDLNAPAAFTISGAPALAYPILDPRNPSGSPSADFTQNSPLAGFQVNPAQIGLAPNSSNPIAPMPSQWLYVLQDGTIVPPGLGSTGTSVIITATNVSASNPIVGRVAFWTDDDTCRVNINTAGDGTFWDTPHYTAPDEWMMAYYSPAEYEYQRYPGHPATTSLLPVLNAVNPTEFVANAFTGIYTINLSMSTSGGYPWYSVYNNSYNPYTPQAYQNLFSLTPQYAYGGSTEATVPETNPTEYSSVAASSPCPLNSQRLYSSVGELMYSSSNNGASPPTRYLNNGTLTGSGTATLLNRQQLETAKFFLTAHSRAPELNLFGTPRVSIWPFTVVNGGVTSTNVSLTGNQVVSTSVRNTATDALLAFASTLNENPAGTSGTSIYPYYFMRASNYDPYTDLNIMRNGSNQNEQVLDYLDSLMSLPVPGFSTLSFDNKYSQIGPSTQTEGRQILEEIFDYIRTVDTEDGVVIYNANNNGSNGLNDIFGAENYTGVGLGNFGCVVPTINTMWAATSGTLEGFGTFPRPTCVMIHFVGLGHGPMTTTTGTYPGINVPTQDLGVAAYGNYDKGNISTSGSVTANRVAVQAYGYVQFVIPASARLYSNPEAFWITMSGLNTLGLTVSGTTVPLGFPSTASELYNINLGGGVGGAYGNDQFTGNDSIFGETNSGAGGANGRVANSTVTPTQGNGSVFAFFSQIITLPYNYVSGGTNTMIISGGNNVVLTLQDASPNTNVIQTVNLNFSQAAKIGAIPFPVNPNYPPGTLATTGAGVPFSSAGFLSIGRMLGTGISSGTNGAGDVSQNDRWMEGGAYYFDQWHDSSASLVLSSSSGWDDPRMLCITNVPATAFVAHQNWGKTQMAYDFTYSPDWDPFPGNTGTAATTGTAGVLVAGAKYAGAMPCVPSQSTGVAFQGGVVGDWDNGVSWTSDGPWINRPDEGGATTAATYSNTGWQYLPYFTGGNGMTTMGPGIFSPNREMPSPAMFGSLPTGVDPSGVNPQHWQTLLFRPGQVINHPGRGRPTEGQPPYSTVPDHLLLDLFWMPVTEPYAISEPFSTAGKVNLNYQILPFGYVTTSGTTAYIRRDTGIRSALESLKIAGVPLSCAGEYKSQTGGNWWGQFPGPANFIGDNGGNVARLPIDVGQTLEQFDSNFENGRVFQSASEICDVYLVPVGYNLTTFESGASGPGSWYGSDFALVGDNVRERPYADIYSRITTKSNTFTVYFTVQELKCPPNSPPNQWNEATGTIVGEYRGSKEMERYLQQSSSMPNFLTYPAPNPVLSGTASLEPFYRWRIIEDNQFAP